MIGNLAAMPGAGAALARLLPQPIAMRENGVRGRLFVDGSAEGNCLLFRFLFDEPEEASPVFLDVGIAGRRFRYLLAGMDIANPMVKSPIVFPDAAVSEGVEILGVRPLVSAPEKAEKMAGPRGIAPHFRIYEICRQ